MSYEVHIQRALALLEQNRYEMAEEPIRMAIAEDPDIGMAYCLLALVMIEKKKVDEAVELSERGIALDPDSGFAHYVHSCVLREQKKIPQAEEAIRLAIELDPTDSDYHAQQASLFLAKKRWQEALDSADTGLQFDPEHIDCSNIRAVALTKLRRRDEAGTTIQSTLARDPEDSITHANMGWTLLHSGEHSKAAEHFREALRLDPDEEWARQGIVEALKAKHFIYRWFLQYTLWMSSFTMRTQLLLFVGVVIILQLMVRLPEEGPLLILGIVLAFSYFTFAMTCWIAYPLFNLLLRLNRFGRLVLTDEQRTDSNWLAAALVAVAIFISGPVVTGFRIGDLLKYLLLLIAVGVTLNVPREARRKLAVGITIGLFLVAAKYWYGWYLQDDLPVNLHDEAAFDQFIEENGDPPNAAFMELVTFVRSQNQLGSIISWGVIGMTWLSSLFHQES